MSTAEPTWLESRLSELRVTQGDVSETASGFLTVVGPHERAQRKEGLHQQAMLQFRYRGPTAETSMVESGGFMRQIGLKMRTKDTCNLLYVMWRIEPVEEIVVQVKSNPGLSQHSECGVNGYHRLARFPLKEIDVTATTHETHRLRASIVELEEIFTCTVMVDQHTLGTVPIAPELIRPIHGPIGMRSDNGSFIFKLFVADGS